MKFDELDAQMRVYETSHDHCLLPYLYICQFPSLALVVDYLRWRSEDAHRNALNAHCYWALRSQKLSVQDATACLSGMSVAAKNELLFELLGVNFNTLPTWQRRGIGIYWENYEQPAVNPKTGATVVATRRRLTRDLELPMRDEYSEFVRTIVATGHETPTKGERG